MILDFRLQKIYDIEANNHTFLFKFSRPDCPNRILLANPGFQIHITEVTWPTPNQPSNFVAKLRKHLINKRLSKISLAKDDRILVFSFPGHYLVFEFFSGGNLLLLDENYKILSLQKTPKISTSSKGSAKESSFPTERYAVRNVYDIDAIINQNEDPVTFPTLTNTDLENWILQQQQQALPPPQESEKKENSEEVSKSKKGRSKRSIPLKSALYVQYPQLSSSLFEQHLSKFGIDPSLSVDKIDFSSDNSFLSKLTDAVNATFEDALKIINSTEVEGYIIAKKNPDYKGPLDKEDGPEDVTIVQSGVALPEATQLKYLLDEFQPFKPTVVAPNTQIVPFPSYNKTVDAFFSTLESLKISMKTLQQEKIAEKRLLAAQQEKNKRLQGLTAIQEQNNLLGQALELHAEQVQAAIDAIKVQLDKKMDWQDLEQLIRVGKNRNDPISKIISLPLNLKENKITLILPHPNNPVVEQKEDSSDSDSDSDSDSSESDSSDGEGNSTKKPKRQKLLKPVKVAVDINLTPWANARRYYEIRREAVAKTERTIQNADKALKSAEMKIIRDLNNAKAKDLNSQQGGGLRTIREQFWFEKFYWFVSSDGYLVLGGRDAMQNNLLFRRYFKKNDIFVYCSQPEASVVIIKNHYKFQDIPPGTLSQAGAFTVASSSKAWDSKNLSAPAWWARFDQIDKISAQNEPIEVSSIHVKGERNDIRQSSTDMGLGFMFVLDDESAKKRGVGSEIKSTATSSVNSSSHDLTESAEKNESDDDSDSDSDDDMFANVKVDKNLLKGKTSVTEEAKLEPKEPVIQEKIGQEEEQNDKQDNEEQSESEDEKAEELANQLDELLVDSKSSEEPEKENGTLSSSGISTPASIAESMTSVTSGKKLTRAQRNKLKKKNLKYADQDEEDRKAAMEKLGTLKGLEKAKQAEQEALARKREQEQRRKESEKRRKELELKKLLEADSAEGNDGDNAQIFPFGKIVGKLHPGETPVAVVPVFGPWQALQKVKIKIRFVPGSIKKSKAIKDILHHITTQAKPDEENRNPDYLWANEVNLIRGIKDTEILSRVAVPKVGFSLPKDTNRSSGGAKGGAGNRGAKNKGSSGKSKKGSKKK